MVVIPKQVNGAGIAKAIGDWLRTCLRGLFSLGGRDDTLRNGSPGTIPL